MLTPPPPPRRLPAARRRQQLIGVALQLFGAGSYHATSMDDIAERAGVTKPVLYQHFPSKSQLYLELIETVGNDLLATVASSAAAESQPSARVLAGFRAYFGFVAAQTDAFRLLFGGGARQDDEFADAVQAVERSIAQTIAGLIDVDLEPDHRELLGYAIVGLAEVTSRQWVRRHEDGLGADGADPTAGERSTVLAGARRPAAAFDSAEGDVLAGRLADLVWAGLRGLPGLSKAHDTGRPGA
jgi:AcrR family transcriptional regulator